MENNKKERKPCYDDYKEIFAKCKSLKEIKETFHFLQELSKQEETTKINRKLSSLDYDRTFCLKSDYKNKNTVDKHMLQ